jgi:hypothetical protein
MNKILNTFVSKYSTLIIILIVIFVLYLFFYTNIIINHQNSKKNIPTEEPISEEPHVIIDVSKNQEIESDRIDINYNAPELNEYQKRSQCEYPSITTDQISKKDCALDGSCLVNIKPTQEWFNQQKAVRTDLPGYNGYSYSNFTSDSFDESKYSMHNLVYPNNIEQIESLSPTQEDFTYQRQQQQYHQHNEISNNVKYPTENNNNIIYENVPFQGQIELRGALPSDLCRSCVVGVCNGDVCGTPQQEFPNYNYN